MPRINKERREIRPLIHSSLTCKSLDVCEENGHLLVAVNVDFVELGRLELPDRLLLLEGNVTDHLLGHERGQHYNRIIEMKKR